VPGFAAEKRDNNGDVRIGLPRLGPNTDQQVLSCHFVEDPVTLFALAFIWGKGWDAIWRTWSRRISGSTPTQPQSWTRVGRNHPRVNLRERLCCVFPSRSRLCLVVSGSSVTGRLGTRARRSHVSLFFFSSRPVCPGDEDGLISPITVRLRPARHVITSRQRNTKPAKSCGNGSSLAVTP
jgi:hypothetical protein